MSMSTQLTKDQELLVQSIKAFSNGIKPITDIIAGWTSNPVTGVPLLAFTGEILYHKLGLSKEYAALILSPSAIFDVGQDVIGDIVPSFTKTTTIKFESTAKLCEHIKEQAVHANKDPFNRIPKPIFVKGKIRFESVVDRLNREYRECLEVQKQKATAKQAQTQAVNNAPKDQSTRFGF